MSLTVDYKRPENLAHQRHPSPITAPTSKQYRIDADDAAQVKVDAAPGVEMVDLDKQRIAEVIAAKLEARRLANPANGDAKQCVVKVTEIPVKWTLNTTESSPPSQ